MFDGLIVGAKATKATKASDGDDGVFLLNGHFCRALMP